MQTQCPHCNTKFRVTETQVETADGFVRCGICKEVFNAIEVNKQQFTQALDEAITESEPAINPAFIETAADKEAFNINEIPDSASKKDAFDFFNEESHESLQHVVPDNFRESYSTSSSLLSTALWSIGILLLTATLFIEYAWFNRDQLNKIPELQATIQSICLQLQCKDISIRDPAKIELITRNVYSHPNEKSALMVNVTMKNNATFAQPYPVMQIDFSDIRGNSVAARRFRPADYLDKDKQQSMLIQPGNSVSIALEIQDPGKQAMTYEFNFL